MNRRLLILLLFLAVSLQYCKVTKPVITEEQVRQEISEKPEKTGKIMGIPGYTEKCLGIDTINSITISKADAVITYQGDRYTARLTLYHKFDSIIYISAVSSGFEVFRGSVDKDTIRVIDRMNKVVYQTPLKKNFGYQHPVQFENLENLTSTYGCCNLMHKAKEYMNQSILFDLSEDFNNKKIYLDRQNFKLKKFEFINTRSGDYIIGNLEKDGSFIFYSNVIIGEFELKATGGEVIYNKQIAVDMNVNKRKYNYIDFQ